MPVYAEVLCFGKQSGNLQVLAFLVVFLNVKRSSPKVLN